MSRRSALIVALVIGMLPATSRADDPDDSSSFAPLKAAEMPVHRFLLRQIAESGAEPADFVTDGCSGGMSAGWSLVADDFADLAATEDGRLPWASCCVIHDRAYHVAGGAAQAEASYDARLKADKALRACIIATGEVRKAEVAERLDTSEDRVETGYRLLADSMYNAVRLGGWPCSGLPWRWGYGYPDCWASFD